MSTRKKRAPQPPDTGTVVPFPPLPRAPAPPRFPADPRQRRSGRIIANIAAVAGMTMRVARPNLTSGYHAAAVDVGQLQQALERGLTRFDAGQLETRWDELSGWMRRVIHAWVQRCKQLGITRAETGIRVEMQTQDDLGYYDYAFDVFPRRAERDRRTPVEIP